MSLPKPYYQDEQATIYCADNRSVLPHLGRFDAVVTDPPYGLGDRMQGGTWGASKKEMMAWDVISSGVLGLIEIGDRVVIWGGNYYPLPASRGWLVWHKPDAVPTTANAELAWTNQDRNTRLLTWSIAATNAERIGHPTQKPLRVMSWTLQQIGVIEGQTILDPYAGSGSTLVAAKLRGIKAVGIEISEAYCAMAVERLRQGVLITA